MTPHWLCFQVRMWSTSGNPLKLTRYSFCHSVVKTCHFGFIKEREFRWNVWNFNCFRVSTKVPSRFHELLVKEITKHFKSVCDVSWDGDLLFVSQEKRIKVSSDEIELFFFIESYRKPVTNDNVRRGKNKFKHFQYFAAGNCHQHRVSLLGARVADVTDRCVHLEEMEAPFAVGPFSSSVSFRTLFANPQVVFFFSFLPRRMEIASVDLCKS